MGVKAAHFRPKKGVEFCPGGSNEFVFRCFRREILFITLRNLITLNYYFCLEGMKFTLGMQHLQEDFILFKILRILTYTLQYQSKIMLIKKINSYHILLNYAYHAMENVQNVKLQDTT